MTLPFCGCVFPKFFFLQLCFCFVVMFPYLRVLRFVVVYYFLQLCFLCCDCGWRFRPPEVLRSLYLRGRGSSESRCTPAAVRMRTMHSNTGAAASRDVGPQRRLWVAYADIGDEKR